MNIYSILDADDTTLKLVEITHSSESLISFTYQSSNIVISEINATIYISSASPTYLLPIETFIAVLRSANYLNGRIIPTDISSEQIELLVTDSKDGISEIHVTLICFSDIDTPPALDLNGPDSPTNNYRAIFYENSSPIQV